MPFMKLHGPLHAGLMAWIVEKFRTWSDCGGDVESRFSKDELLTNVAI
jgi:microsomal epoxide hydrolase